jgi:hypothetical protein
LRSGKYLGGQTTWLTAVLTPFGAKRHNPPAPVLVQPSPQGTKAKTNVSTMGVLVGLLSSAAQSIDDAFAFGFGRLRQDPIAKSGNLELPFVRCSFHATDLDHKRVEVYGQGRGLRTQQGDITKANEVVQE